MTLLLGLAIVSVCVLGPIIWSIFVHPIRSFITVLKLGLGLGGIYFLVTGIAGDRLDYGSLGVVLLFGASMVSRSPSLRA